MQEPNLAMEYNQRAQATLCVCVLACLGQSDNRKLQRRNRKEQHRKKYELFVS